jgi:hypothetical protein
MFLDITPDSGCKPADCFENVRRKLEKEGGRIQYGWALWEWPQVFIEAEHHAVFDPGGECSWRDVTPCQQRNRRRLFLPDDSATYDFSNEGFRRENIRFALCDDPLIQTLFKAARRRSAFYNGLPGVGGISISASEDKEQLKLERAVANATAALMKKYGRG